jgi:uncharacterized protein (DUF1330 family)
MPAYVIADINVHNADEYESYKKISSEAAAAYGGKFVVRGGKSEVLEGTWEPRRTVVLEFSSVEQAKAWWNSEEYAPGKAIRQRTATSNIIVVEGL